MAKLRLSAEEQAARQAAVRRQRELMFRAELKNKRLNKIKSKTYRRLARKEAKNDGLSMEELEQLDELDEGTRAAEARERMETQRARERASLRHSAKSTKFARDVNGMYGLEVDDELRRAEVDRVQREAALRKKIVDHHSGSESDQDSEADDEEADDDAIKTAALKSLDQAASKDQQDEQPKGLMGMKFMRAAQARRDAEQQELEDAFRREMEGDEEADDVDKDHASVQGNAGRRVFVPSKATQAASEAEQVCSFSSRCYLVLKSPFYQAEEGTKTSKKAPKNQTVSKTITIDAPQPSTSNTEQAAPVNPWLAAASADIASTSKASTKEIKQATAADKANLKARKQKSKHADERAKQQQENQVELDESQLLTKQKKPRQRKSKAERKEARERRQQENPEAAEGQAETSVAPALDADEGSSSEDDEELDDDAVIFRQRDLVARAFAGDDVVAVSVPDL